MLVALFFSVIGFIAVILACMSIYNYIQNKETLKTQSERVEQVVNLKTAFSSEQAENPNPNADTGQGLLRKDLRISSIPWLNEFFAKHLKEKSKSIMVLIEQTGLKIKVSEFLLFVAIVALIGELLLDLFFHIPIVGIGAGAVPFFMLNMLRQKRIDRFVAQMPQGLDLLSSDLRAGLDVQAGLKHLSEEFPAPVGEEFAKVVAEINLGLTLSQALNNLSARMNTMDVQILCTGIIINKELGGNLSELIGSISETVRERFRLKGMVKALTAENQMSALLLVFLPIGLFILLNIMSPLIYNSFVFDPVGRMCLIGCAVSMSMGYMIINKITKIEV